ncbi:DNA methylase [Gordonia phage Wocket]|nr:DNA methylase [Gordonia phage Wocket]
MTPYYADESVTLHHGDCLDVLRELPDNSVDSVVTDPPYGLEFMGKDWDAPWKSASVGRGVKVAEQRAGEMTQSGRGHATSAGPYLAARVDSVRVAGAPFQAWCTEWATECLRILKPGGHLVAFGGSRTWHRLAAAVEDAGFEIRDSIAWLYGSGFPKSLDVSKAIDKVRDDEAEIRCVTEWLAEQRDSAGITNRQIDEHFGFAGMAGHWTARPHVKIAQVPQWEQWIRLQKLIGFDDTMNDEVQRLNGRKGEWGNARPDRDVSEPGRNSVLSPTQRVRDSGTPATDAAHKWAGWGTALKPAFEPIVVGRKPLAGTVAQNVLTHGTGALNIDASRTGGRWPTNVVLDESQAAALDDQAPNTGAGGRASGPTLTGKTAGTVAYGARNGLDRAAVFYGDSGGASRFFPTFRYEAKAPTSERPNVDGVQHPTVKPLDLMRWLVRLVTPPNGVVLEPFAGSGTTAEACVHEHMRCIAIEREADYLPLIVSRLTKPIEVGFDFGSAL